MDQSTNEPVYEAHSMKDMLHKNCMEKAVYARKQKNIENERKCLLRQHSRDETEIKQILQRLQHQQHQLADEEDDKHEKDDDDNPEHNDTDDNSDDNAIINPYPVTIVPKFGPPSPRSDCQSKLKKGVMQGTRPRTDRRKSLEYEDIDISSLHRKNKHHFKAPVIAASFVNRLQSQSSNRKVKPIPEQNDTPDMWVGDPEFISSVRRQRKPVSEFGQRKFLKRALSEIWSRPDSASNSSTSSISNVRREGSLKSGKNIKESDTVSPENKSDYDITSAQQGKKDKSKVHSNEEKYQNITDKSSNAKRKLSTEKRKISTDECGNADRKSSFPGRKDSKPEKSEPNIVWKDALKSLDKLTIDDKDKKTSLSTEYNSQQTDTDVERLQETNRGETTSRLTGNTRHGSIKNKKEKSVSKSSAHVKQKKILTPIKIGVASSKPEAELSPDGMHTRDNIKKIRSKSVGTSPGASPLTSPVVKDGKFNY